MQSLAFRVVFVFIIASIAKPVYNLPRSCELQCLFGATCKFRLAQWRCSCDFKCTSSNDERDITKAPGDTIVCGTDGNTYGSECQLKLFSCRYQKPIDVVGEGSCEKYSVSGEMSERDRNVLDSVKDVPNKSELEITNHLETTTDADDSPWETIFYRTEGDDETVTEFMEIDETSCDRKQKKHFEDRCEEVYEMSNDKAQAIEDEKKRAEAACCALEDYEKCSLRAFDQANCVADKEDFRENMKAARLFLTVVSGVTCSEFRDRCAVLRSAAVTWYATYVIILMSVGVHFIANFCKSSL